MSHSLVFDDPDVAIHERSLDCTALQNRDLAGSRFARSARSLPSSETCHWLRFVGFAECGGERTGVHHACWGGIERLSSLPDEHSDPLPGIINFLFLLKHLRTRRRPLLRCSSQSQKPRYALLTSYNHSLLAKPCIPQNSINVACIMK